MIPPLSPALLPVRPVLFHHSAPECKIHILAIGILASAALFLTLPWELAVPLSVCVLSLSMLFSLPPCPSNTTAPPSLRVKTVESVYVPPCPVVMASTPPVYVEPIYVSPSPVYNPPPILPVPRPIVAPRPRVPIRIPPPAPPNGRAPVGTGARTPVAPPPSIIPAVRAPVGGGARTPIQLNMASTHNPARAPVGGR